MQLLLNTGEGPTPIHFTTSAGPKHFGSRDLGTSMDEDVPTRVYFYLRTYVKGAKDRHSARISRFRLIVYFEIRHILCWRPRAEALPLTAGQPSHRPSCRGRSSVSLSFNSIPPWARVRHLWT